MQTLSSATKKLLDNLPKEEASDYLTEPYKHGYAYETFRDSLTASPRQVVVFIESGNYLDPQELGRYSDEIVARTILGHLGVQNFYMFYLDTGEPVLTH